MAVACARCRLRFPGRRSWRLVWCSSDHSYYCGKCYHEACEPVHGDRPAVGAQHRLIGIGALVVFGSGLVPFSLLTLLLPGTSPPPPDYWALGVAILGIVGTGAAWFSFSFAVRRLFHAWTLRDLPSRSAVVLEEVADPRWSWRPNHAAFPRRLVFLASVVGVAGAIDAIVLVWIATSTPTGYPGFAVAMMSIASLVGGAAAFLAVLPFSVPSAIAVADDGIHLWYDSVYDRRTLQEVMPWVDLNILGMSAPGGSDPARTLVRLLRIDHENATAIASEWQMHRIAPPSTGSVRATPQPRAPQSRPSSSAVAAQSTLGLGPRGTVCARCHVQFPGVEGLRLLWCKVDRFYVCRTCWETGCEEGHGRGIRAVSKPARVASSVVIVAMFLASWYPGVVYDYRLTNAWRNAPVVSVSSLQPGQLDKVQATIAPGEPFAWSGHEEYFSEGGWQWSWNTTDTFLVRDASGQVLVTTENWYIIYNGPRDAPYAVHTEMTMYSSGDSIQIVGTVGRLADGTLHLAVQVMALTQFVDVITLSPSVPATVAYVAIPITISAVLGVGVAVLLGRRLRSRRAIGTQPALSIDESGGVRDPSLDWRPNGRGTDPKRRIRWAVLFIGVGAALLVIYPGVSPRTWWGYYSLGFVGTIVLMFEAAIVYMILFGSIGHPSVVAADESGFHLWYNSPYDRYLNDTLFEWDKVRDIFMTSGKGRHWALRWTTGEVTNLYMLNGRNLQLLLSEWARRRMMPST